MASFKDYWARLQGRNPGLTQDDTVMRINVAAFRKSLEQAYAQGDADRKSFHDSLEKIKGRGGSFGDIFKGL